MTSRQLLRASERSFFTMVRAKNIALVQKKSLCPGTTVVPGQYHLSSKGQTRLSFTGSGFTPDSSCFISLKASQKFLILQDTEIYRNKKGLVPANKQPVQDLNFIQLQDRPFCLLGDEWCYPVTKMLSQGNTIYPPKGKLVYPSQVQVLVPIHNASFLLKHLRSS